jgi:hypothetical protein
MKKALKSKKSWIKLTVNMLSCNSLERFDEMVALAGSFSIFVLLQEPSRATQSERSRQAI